MVLIESRVAAVLRQTAGSLGVLCVFSLVLLCKAIARSFRAAGKVVTFSIEITDTGYGFAKQTFRSVRTAAKLRGFRRQSGGS